MPVLVATLDGRQACGRAGGGEGEGSEWVLMW